MLLVVLPGRPAPIKAEGMRGAEWIIFVLNITIISI